MSTPNGTCDDGVILTVGVFSGVDRMAIVIPVYNEDGSLDNLTMCEKAILDFISSQLTLLTSCLAQNSYVTHINSEAMTNGKIPYRTDFSPTDHPGTVTSDALPSHTTGLVIFYQDPTDVTPPNRIHVGKNFMPAVPSGEVTNDGISVGLFNDYAAFASPFLDGYGSSGQKWYRAVRAPKNRAASTPVERIGVTTARGYVCTQKRRLVPRG